MELGELESNLENRTTEKAPEDTIMQDMAEIGKGKNFPFEYFYTKSD